MPRITVNPEVKSAGEFPLWAKGTYRVRLENVEQVLSKNGKEMLRFRLFPAQEVMDETGSPLGNAGSLIDQVMIEPIVGKNGQSVSFLRPVIESAGLSWTDFDTEELEGKEVTVRVGLREFEGKPRNEITSYIKA